MNQELSSLLGGAAGTDRHRFGRLLAAHMLLRASAFLAGLAAGIADAAESPAHEPVLEFYAEAGAPEGALYADGMLTGTVSGVSRL